MHLPPYILRRLCIGVLTAGFFLLLLDTDLPAQTHTFHCYDIKDGLPQSQVYAIFQDSHGFMWFGTNGGGIARFDGYQFQQFTQKDGLSSNVIYAICEDRAGHIWIGTSHGLNIYDGQHFTNYGQIAETKGRINVVFENKEGQIWLGRQNGGVSRYIGRPGTLPDTATPTFKKVAPHELGDRTVNDIYQKNKEEHWIATDNGIAIINKDTVVRKITEKDGLSSRVVHTILEDSSGIVWIGTNNALHKYMHDNIVPLHRSELKDHLFFKSALEDKPGHLWFGTYGDGLVLYQDGKFKQITASQGLSADRVEALYRDREGNIWVGTSGGGVCKYHGDVFVTYNSKHGLSNDIVLTVKGTMQEDLWIGTYGGGVNYFDGADFEVVSQAQGLFNDIIWDVHPQEQQIWLATAIGLGRLDIRSLNPLRYTIREYSVKQHGLASNTIWTITEAMDGVLWMGTRGGLSRFENGRFTSLTEADGLCDNRVRCIFEASDRKLWIGTDRGVCIYDGDTFRIFDPGGKIGQARVFSIRRPEPDHIWMATYGDGLFHYTRKDNKWVLTGHYTTEDGLSDGAVVSMLFIDPDNILLGTNKGIDRLELEAHSEEGTVNIRHYGIQQGLEGVECNPNAIYKDMDGYIWIGTLRGLVRYNPSADRLNPIPPKVHITGLRMFLEEVNWRNYADSLTQTGLPASLTLPYHQNYLTFDFVGISLKVPQATRYQWKLEGFDERWSPVSTQRHATYSNLSPGNYTFKLQACNNDGVWVEAPATYNFTITPPFWQTTWFYAGSVLFALFSVYGVIWLRTRNIQQTKRLLEHKVKERTHQLEEAYDAIEQQNTDITSSIQYAQRIQEAILPMKKEILRDFPQAFIFYRPKEIVSGDFYWYNRKKDLRIIACVDCTGHGVPGAFMSMIANNLLNQIVGEKNIIDPGRILKALDEGITFALKQEHEETETKDGMDIAICTCRPNARELKFAGALRPLYRVDRKSKFREIKGTPLSIGGEYVKNKRFKTHTLKISAGDTFYICSDGYADQFGGTHNKKFMTKNFKNMLVNLQGKPMSEQHDILGKTITEWQGDYEQIDDMLVIGMHFS